MTPSCDHRCEVCGTKRSFTTPIIISIVKCSTCGVETWGYPYDQAGLARLPQQFLLLSLVQHYQKAAERSVL